MAATNQKSEYEELLKILEERFHQNMNRHPKTTWKSVAEKLTDKKLSVLMKMEETGGEPDVVDFGTREIIFSDCSAESPKGRRSFCFDDAALASRKENKPKDSAENAAKKIGIEILNEEQYRVIQQSGEFDLKTSSWLQTPEKIRKLGGALFGDRRYDTVFTYHNGAESYYSARGFRGILKL